MNNAFDGKFQQKFGIPGAKKNLTNILQQPQIPENFNHGLIYKTHDTFSFIAEDVTDFTEIKCCATSYIITRKNS